METGKEVRSDCSAFLEELQIKHANAEKSDIVFLFHLTLSTFIFFLSAFSSNRAKSTRHAP